MSYEYRWRLTCMQGVIDEADNAQRPQNSRVDPQRPPTMLGDPTLIELLPVNDGKSVRVQLGRGCLPVIHRLHSVDQSGTQKLLAYRVGTAWAGTRVMIRVDADTGDISLDRDYVGD